MRVYSLNATSEITQAITWQYDKSSALVTLIQSEQDFYNSAVRDFWVNWERDVFNIDTANYFGLIVWATILGCTEYVEQTKKIRGTSFGFGQVHKNFYKSNFSISSYVKSLPIESLRKLLKAQMYNFNSNGSIASYNRLLAMLFPNSEAYIEYDRDNNSVDFYFTNQLDDEDLNLILFSNICPVPVGVKRTIHNGEE